MPIVKVGETQIPKINTRNPEITRKGSTTSYSGTSDEPNHNQREQRRRTAGRPMNQITIKGNNDVV